MLIRICLIIAIVAGLAAAGIGFLKVREKIVTTMAERDEESFLWFGPGGGNL